MTQQFEYSLDVQGNVDQFSSEFSLATVPHSPAIHPVKQKLKKKRGRPRKALPLNILSPDFSRQTDSHRNDWESNQIVAQTVAEKNNVLCNPAAGLSVADDQQIDHPQKTLILDKDSSHNDYQDSEYSKDNEKKLPFFDDELATLDEFEKLSRPVEQNLSGLYEFKRIDQPATTPAPVALPKQKKNIRRRQIDPSTCERDYSPDEVEFMNALSEYKRTSGRMFPTCSEILEVLKNLGYEKRHSEPEYDWNKNDPELSPTY
ncbi:MAG: hypothetical protein LBG58_05970 [Planctomycetaceae bacterium]|jgi:hypothetical protein|nr:hypothetical protein [Planctomycetaceae bacterium]